MNFSDLSQNAVLAKARAMYAGTLTNEIMLILQTAAPSTRLPTI